MPPVEDQVLPAATVRTFATRCLQKVGTPEPTAEAVIDNLIDADLRGVVSHGVPRLINVYVERIEAGAMNPAAQPEVIRESASTALIDAKDGFGVLAGVLARDLVAAKTRDVGCAWAGVTHSTHFGTCAYYTNRLAAQGMVGFAFTNAPPTMAPWGGIEPHLGTNPIAVAVPTTGGIPLSVDLATSVVARGHLLLALTKGDPIPEGWAQDPEGNPTTSAADGLAGSVLPMSGHKGYALAFMVDVLSGVLTGAAFGRGVGQLYGDLDRPQDVGHLLGAIDISAFLPVDEFCTRLDQMIAQIKNSPLAAWADQILVPGELEGRERERQGDDGQIRIAPAVHAQMVALGKRLGVPLDEQ